MSINPLREFLYFGVRQAYACLFGGALLVAILATRFLWHSDWPIARYDFLLVYALVIQGAFIMLKLESLEEVKVIFLFHVVGTIMEIFKTHIGAWSYPENCVLHIVGVPLFSGFMYSAVGSYLARVWRIFHFKFDGYPRFGLTVLLCAGIYINFFSHHFVPDARYALFALTAVLFWRTRVHYKPHQTYFSMPLLLGWGLVSLFIWIAENVGTFGRIWVYPSQNTAWHVVPMAKMGSWYLLMIISFVLVTLVHSRDDIFREKLPQRIS